MKLNFKAFREWTAEKTALLLRQTLNIYFVEWIVFAFWLCFIVIIMERRRKKNLILGSHVFHCYCRVFYFVILAVLTQTSWPRIRKLYFRSLLGCYSAESLIISHKFREWCILNMRHLIFSIFECSCKVILAGVKQILRCLTSDTFHWKECIVVFQA